MRTTLTIKDFQEFGDIEVYLEVLDPSQLDDVESYELRDFELVDPELDLSYEEMEELSAIAMDEYIYLYESQDRVRVEDL